jgi:hypothetical protein
VRDFAALYVADRSGSLIRRCGLDVRFARNWTSLFMSEHRLLGPLQ